MANESQDLVFNLKANTSNAEQGMGKINSLTDDLKITTEKTSGALRQFGGQLKQVRDLSDVAGVATNALGQVLGASLGGTAVLVAGKALIDAFNVVQNAVKETSNKVKDAFKEIEKGGLPKTFEESANQANKLAFAADEVSKKVKEIESNPLQKFIASITGAKDKMEELALSTQKAAQERIRLGVQSAIADEQFQSGLSDKEKKLNDLFKSYQEKADKISASMLAAGASPEEIKPVIDEIYNAHTQARDKMLADFAIKELSVGEENAKKISDAKRANDMAEFDLEQKSQNTIFENERARLNESISERLKAADDEAKKREESAKKLEEFQVKYLALTEKRVALEEKISSINDQISAKQGELAQQGAGLGGTMRGPGQQPSSYEIGFKKTIDRATQNAQRIDAQNAKNILQDSILRKMGLDPSKMTKAEKNAVRGASPEAIQIEQKRIAAEAAANKATENGTKSLDKLNEKLDDTQNQLDQNVASSKELEEAYMELQDGTEGATDALKEFTTQSQKASETQAGKAGEQQANPVVQALDDIYELLYNTLDELKTYAHTT